MLSAKVIADSRNDRGSRLTTVLCRYPLIIHNEVMTHRDFSRNAASSRAIPVEKMIRDVKENPFVPYVWLKNQPGMQGYEQLGVDDEREVCQIWRMGMLSAVETADQLRKKGVHKQIANRPLMPYMYITTLISSTRWANFFALRLHKTAEPHVRLLADHIEHAIRFSVPEQLKLDDMHLPFVTKGERAAMARIDQIRISVARCASTSYKTVDGFDMSIDRARAIHDSLLKAKPMHASPAEHVAFVGDTGESGNFDPGWIQYRKTIPGECISPEAWLEMRADEDFKFNDTASSV